MSLFAAAHQGLITTTFVPPRADLYLDNGDAVEYSVPLELPDNAALVKSAGNQIRGAFVLSALQTHRELEARPNDRAQANPSDPNLSAARTVLAIISGSVEGNLVAPAWNIPELQRRRHVIPEPDFTLDATDLDGQEIRWDHFGGLPRYLDLTLYLAARLDESAGHSDTDRLHRDYGYPGRLASQTSSVAPAGPAGVRPGYGSGAGRLRRLGNAAANDTSPAGWIAPTSRPAPRFSIASQASEDGPVADFVSQVCRTGGRAMTLASELYASYASWCLDNGYLAVSQRKFGLELTASGYQRKRRGKGRHWWVGLQPAE